MRKKKVRWGVITSGCETLLMWKTADNNGVHCNLLEAVVRHPASLKYYYDVFLMQIKWNILCFPEVICCILWFNALAVHMYRTVIIVICYEYGVQNYNFLNFVAKELWPHQS